MNIYQIDQAIQDLVDPETGDIADWNALEQLQIERDIKIENVACWYKNLIAEANAIKQEEGNLAERRKAVENKAERLKEYLKNALDGQKFSTPRCAITWRKTISVIVEDSAAAVEWAEIHGHKECVRYKAPEISKPELSKLLKAGAEIPGAALAEGLSMGVK